MSRLDVPAFRHGPFFVSEGRSVGEVWGTAFATDCADLAPVGVTDCGSFEVNDDGLLVATGRGNDFTQGFAKGLWDTAVAVTDAMGDTLTYRWGLPIAVRDRSPACVARDPGKREDCPLTGFLPLGNTTPEFNASFATNLRYKSLTFSGLLEASVGHSIYNRTARPDPVWLRGPDLDQGGKPPGHQKPVAYVSALRTGERNSWLLEDGDWLKVREMSVSYTLPEDLIQSLFGGAFRRVTLTAAGSRQQPVHVHGLPRLRPGGRDLRRGPRQSAGERRGFLRLSELSDVHLLGGNRVLNLLQGAAPCLLSQGSVSV
ncbi:hypothetical protein [Candidatus Palauibacter sp.]|uniref:hypothetical protein n=1 Tax=Candidatus Palauibacter sp. TaxID=3101350 RepID=UPI003C6F852B